MLTRRSRSGKITLTDQQIHSEDMMDSGKYYLNNKKSQSIGEPNCDSICVNESSGGGDENNFSLMVTRDNVHFLLTLHLEDIGGRLNLLQIIDSEREDTTEEIKSSIKESEAHEINALLLYASFLGKNNWITQLHKAGADLNYCENTRRMSALHLCAYTDNLIGIQYLMSHGAKINCNQIYTPFHYAAFGNSVTVANYFLELGIPQVSTKADESVLHVAARSNAIDVIKLLASKNDLLDILDMTGLAPIHYVAAYDNSSCLSSLIDADCNIDITTELNSTALHFAAEHGCTENVKLLLENNANVRIKNYQGRTALHDAAFANSFECVKALLQNGGFEPNEGDGYGRTILHLALLGRSPSKAYDITKLLIELGMDINKADKGGDTPLHIAARAGLSECVELLIQHGADLTARNDSHKTALSIIIIKIPKLLSVFKERLDASIILDQHNSAKDEIKLHLDFNILLQRNNQGEIDYLNILVNEGYKEILEHPLCQSFLYLKWRKIRKYYFCHFFSYLIYIFLLTLWVMTALTYNWYNETHDLVNENGSLPLRANSTGSNGFFHRHPKVLEIGWYVLLYISIIESVRKIAGIHHYSSVRQFFTQLENIIEWYVVLSVCLISFIYTGRTYVWQNYVGAFAVLCGWCNLILLIGKLPMFGVYIAMFISVQAQVSKLLLAFAFLLIGFTASFCIIFPHLTLFNNPYTGFINVLVMMTGELNFENFIPTSEENTSGMILGVMAQLLFLLFVLFITIVLMNLLVGIAVHDVVGLQKTASLDQLVRITESISSVETTFSLVSLFRSYNGIGSWMKFILPSLLNNTLDIKPFDPKENRVPRDVLIAAYHIAKNQECIANTYQKTSEHENEATIDLQNKIIELTKICEDNRELIQNLITVLADKKIIY